MAMLSGRGRLPAVTAMTVAFLACTAAFAQTPAELLIGRWELVSQRRVVDGKGDTDRPVSDKGRSIIDFSTDGTWRIFASSHKGSHGTYRWLGPDRIASTTIKAPIPAGNGARRTLSVEVEERQLTLTVALSAEELKKSGGQAKPDVSYPQEQVVVSTFRRLPD
ncbi:hypothetical protein E9232_005541 [Inquilinus ginsengisoli]|uniref:Lipocalin-like domain-containing protein n=1 Tax=Inquilinus ginsengisoli TaxID=363840 RepID=A0ABU1JWK1_9PROT|nr:hypothetical protein [Inquilinus ginsengisoli]MDR6292996.1 hypothetical protein [Inquilinus ginsengisoli]